MHNVHDLNDYEDLLKEVLHHKNLLLYNRVQLNKDHIIHSMLLDQPLKNKNKKRKIQITFRFFSK